MIRSQKVRFRNVRCPCDLLWHDRPLDCRETKSYFKRETKRVVLPSLSEISKGKYPNKYISSGTSIHSADKHKFGRLLIQLSEILSQSVQHKGWSLKGSWRPPTGRKRCRPNPPPTVLQLPHYRDSVLLGTDGRYVDSESLNEMNSLPDLHRHLSTAKGDRQYPTG